MSNPRSARVAQWFELLDPSAKQALVDLNLREGDRLPEEFVQGLRDHGISVVEWEQPALGYVVPGELLDLLGELRQD
ncbi:MULTISPECIES: hypothetical protein [unclassified Streptomyces]|uniref:hypothetical protein n=1 Tax=unclassified Streptomyces TaxID=2593676 RepID=UPI00386404E5|nr:hypothetical protein OG569_26730 [Streptomyces sp. NBC_00827]